MNNIDYIMFNVLLTSYMLYWLHVTHTYDKVEVEVKEIKIDFNLLARFSFVKYIDMFVLPVQLCLQD